MDARKRGMILQNAPQVLFRNDPPLELEGVPGVNNAGEGEMSYVTFGIAPSRLHRISSLLLTMHSSFPSSLDSPAPLREYHPHPDLP